MSLIPKVYMEAVLSIGTRSNAGINWIGTGFFVVKIIDDDKYQTIFYKGIMPSEKGFRFSSGL